MGYSSGSIVSAAPAAAVSQKIKDLCGTTGLTNWSFVENIPAGTGTGQSGSNSYSIDVFKCAGTGGDANSIGLDFYVAMRIPVPDGAVNPIFNVFEDYEGSTNKRFRRPVSNSTTLAPVGSGYWRTDTLAAAASVAGVRDLSLTTLNTTGFSHFLSMTNDTLVLVVIVGSTGGGILVCTGDTFVAPALATDKLIAATGTAASALSVSREPGVTDAANSKFVYNNPTDWTITQGSNSANDVDFFQQGKLIASRIAVNRTGSVGHLIGKLRGLLNSSLLTMDSGGTINVGDTIVINGVTYAVMDTGTGGQTNNGAIMPAGRVLLSPAT